MEDWKKEGKLEDWKEHSLPHFQFFRPSSLFGGSLPYQHLPGRREITRSEGVKIEATRHALAEGIPTIPIRRTALALVAPYSLMS